VQVQEAMAKATPAPVSVTIQPAIAQSVERTVDFVGTLNADAEASVATEVDGRLISIDADLGDHVEKGQILAKLDGAELRARLREAEAAVEKAESDAQRAARLRAQNVMSPQESDAMVSAQSIARARRDVLAIQVGHTEIRAPFDGMIAKRMVDVGNYVKTGTALFVVVADHPLRLRGEVPERFAAELKVGQQVRGYVEAYPDTAVRGRLTRISPAANPINRALTIEAEVPNADGRLKPGFFCKASVLTRTESEAVVIPVDALVNFAGVTRVFVIDDQLTARTRPVETGLRLGTTVEVTAGVKPGERLATSALAHLTDGARVTIREGEGKVAEARR
jgi:membrane fusion protein (multidrug efflux system)